MFLLSPCKDPVSLYSIAFVHISKFGGFKISGSRSRVMASCCERWSDGFGFVSRNEDAAPVRCGEEGTEPEGEAFSLLVHLSSNPHLWSHDLAFDRKDGYRRVKWVSFEGSIKATVYPESWPFPLHFQKMPLLCTFYPSVASYLSDLSLWCWFDCCHFIGAWVNVTLNARSCVWVCDCRKWTSALPGLSSAQLASHSAEASGFPHVGQKIRGVPLKLSAELSQQELQPASWQLVFI